MSVNMMAASLRCSVSALTVYLRSPPGHCADSARRKNCADFIFQRAIEALAPDRFRYGVEDQRSGDRNAVRESPDEMRCLPAGQNVRLQRDQASERPHPF